MTIRAFKKRVRGYYRVHKRDFPWRRTRNPYCIFVSEVMLQQTQTDRVAPKYRSFIKRFPGFRALADAPLRDVLQEWQGLGYNRRAKFLKRAAEIIVAEHNGKLPCDERSLVALPGIGGNTAGSIRAFAFNEPSVFVETNIRTVFIHHFFARERVVDDAEICMLVEKTLDRKNPREWYFALMDYGVMIKKTIGNQNAKSKHYTKQSRFEGSDRQIRGAILRALSRHGPLTKKQLCQYIDSPCPQKRIQTQIGALEKEGFVVLKREVVSLV